MIDNLLDNAIKHADGEVRLIASGNGSRARVEISDDGHGIPASERQAIFEKFRRLESSAAGSGLGLWLCHELVTRMGGTIQVDDAAGGGALFVIELQAAGS